MEAEPLECGECVDGYEERAVYPHPDVTTRRTCWVCGGSNTRPCMWKGCRDVAMALLPEDSFLALCASHLAEAQALEAQEKAKEEWKRLHMEALQKREGEAKQALEVARTHREDSSSRLAATLRAFLPQVTGPARAPLAEALLGYQCCTAQLVAAAEAYSQVQDELAAARAGATQ
jgi:hypothetical protein